MPIKTEINFTDETKATGEFLVALVKHWYATRPGTEQRRRSHGPATNGRRRLTHRCDCPISATGWRWRGTFTKRWPRAQTSQSPLRLMIMLLLNIRRRFD